MTHLSRRHDIDWLRVIAIALLIIYHIAIGFQPWGLMIGFITNKESWTSLWTPMSLLNVWRIPLLFFVAGMGVFFAMQKRNWLDLIKERSRRILLPLVFGMTAIVPIHLFILQSYYSWQLSYSPHPSHLWFLGNIFIYTLLLLPLFMAVKNNLHGKLVQLLQKLFSSPIGLSIVMAFFVLEATILKPVPFELYAMTTHGFILGFLAFLFGYVFVLAGKPFWHMLVKLRWVFFLAAFLLYIYRIFTSQIPLFLLSIESNFWVFAVFAFAYLHLNKPSAMLSYLSQSAYPIYIIHMVVLYGLSYLIFPLNLNVMVKFILLSVLTLLVSVLLYELFIRRLAVLRPLFGLKAKSTSVNQQQSNV